MPKTYEPIATYTVPSAQASYTFTSIPSTYTDLVIVANFGKSADVSIKFRVNGDTGSNYSVTALYGDGSAAGSFRGSNVTFGEFSYFPSTTALATALISFQNYSNTTTNKTVLARSGEAGSSTWAYVNLWRSTAAINSITLLPNGANFNTGSTFTLYGIKAA